MAAASISVDQDQFICPVCLDLPKDPVTIPCGHSFCMVCINSCWDEEDQSGVYKCPQCRETFTPRPIQRRNYFIAEMLEKLQKTEEAPARPHATPGDMDCDFCTRSKTKAVKSCLVCRVSFCETHLRPHFEVLALRTHRLVEASAGLQEKICSKHDEVVKIYCRTDHQFICYLCTMNKHKGHNTVAVVEERSEKQAQLKHVQIKVQQKIQENEEKLLEVRQDLDTLKSSAQAAVEDSEKIFAELIRSLEKKRSDVIKLIRAQEKAQLSGPEGLLEKLKQEISDLKRRQAELEQLSLTEDDFHFLQSFQSFDISFRSVDTSTITVNKYLSFDEVRKSLFDLKERLEGYCKEEFRMVPQAPERERIRLRQRPVKTTVFLQSPERPWFIAREQPVTRSELLQYFCHLTLDPNTVHNHLVLLNGNRMVRQSNKNQCYPDCPERFDHWPQVLCKESVRGCCYWEVEWSSGTGSEWVYIGVSYKGLSRKGHSDECALGNNSQSWSLGGASTFTFWHKNVEIMIPTPPPTRIGVFVDYDAGTLSFYGISDIMTLLCRAQTTFTQPLYPGFWVGAGSAVALVSQ